MKKLIIFTFFVFFSFKITAFPGDHNSLTCTKYLFAEFDSNGEPILDSTGFPKINSELQRLYYCEYTIYHADFECGTIENNTFDFLNSTYVQYHNPKPEGCK
jgi:hypothetical protein